jgi:PAS domain S-box-containing protein
MAWCLAALGFYPLVAWLKGGPLADRVIPLDTFQFEILAVASYVGILLFLAFSFVLFRRRLGSAVAVLRRQTVALRKSESFLEESQRVARVGSYDLDVTTGLWTGSALLEDLFGIDASFNHDFNGWLALIHQDERVELGRYLDQEVLHGSGVFDREYRVVRRENGQLLWVHGRGLVFRDPTGRPVRMIGTIQDITALRLNEEERRTLQTRLANSQKLESLGVLAGGVAHDFNNLLTGILGNILLARSMLPFGREDLASRMQQAESAATRAVELTRQMLAFSGRGHFVIQSVDLNAAMSEMVELLRSGLSTKVSFRFELDPGSPCILADASQVRQVVMNLIINAAEAIGEQPGVITLRTEVRDIDAAFLATGFSVGALEAGRHVCAQIVDTGCGMDEETRSRIFDPFFTTKFIGRGLGLAAVLGIVKGHHGAIWATSSLGLGTTFSVLFPSAPCSPPPQAPLVSEAVPDRFSGRVLVIDDEELVRDLVGVVLEEAGFEVVLAESGPAGLDVIREWVAKIDVVLLDLTMPGMGGLEVFAELKKLRPDLRVVLTSGYTRGNVLRQFIDVVPDDFIEKPFQPADLVAAVRRNMRG